MIHAPLTMFAYVDFAGQVRGKGVPTREAERRLATGIGWTPTNIMFTALGTIAPSPWSSFGDVVLKPDPATRVLVDYDDGTPAERFFLADLLTTDGAPWEPCPRGLLKAAIADLAAWGITVRAAFEHEFVYGGANARAADLYAFEAIRRHGPFGETLLAALDAAGVPVDSYLPEFGHAQFEVTTPPADALAAADRAVILREIVRATAWRLGHTVTFSPRPSPDGLGSGVHIHFSLWDADGRPLSHDPAAPHGVSALAGSFLGGVIAHMPALAAFTAPSPISYLRLVPNAWTGIWSNLGVQDREAGIRICPTFGGRDAAARQFNFEYRAADATANPYIALAAILRAGLSGVAERRPAPEPTVEVDPGAMTAAERAARGIVRLPESLDAALEALDADATFRALLPRRFVDAYRTNREAEATVAAGWDDATLCARYAAVY
jgi:glutamine synthetase